MRIPKALSTALKRGARERAATPLPSAAVIGSAAPRHALVAQMSLTSRLIRGMARSPERLRELERIANAQPGDQDTQAVYLETLQECVWEGVGEELGGGWWWWWGADGM